MILFALESKRERGLVIVEARARPTGTECALQQSQPFQTMS
jgi:hypothetical protein